MIFDLLMALGVMWFFTFSIYCAYLRAVGTKTTNMNSFVGKLIWTWGEVFIIATIATSVGTLSMICAMWIIKYL
jgi:hypothetical protein